MGYLLIAQTMENLGAMGNLGADVPVLQQEGSSREQSAERACDSVTGLGSLLCYLQVHPKIVRAREAHGRCLPGIAPRPVLHPARELEVSIIYAQVRMQASQAGFPGGLISRAISCLVCAALRI
jgi:hypothetical protein